MNTGSGFSVSKPISAWNRPLKANFKDLFKALGKGVINGAIGKWEGVAGDLVEASVAVGLAADPGQIAWLLIYRSLDRAITRLLKDNKELLVRQPEDLSSLCEHIDWSLERTELTINQDFFRTPKQLPILNAFKVPLTAWLESFVEKPVEAKGISDRLPTYFVFALHEEWRARAKDYECLKTQLDTPFTKASEREQAWLRYRALLQQQVEEPMFLEAFGLKQVYVPLCAYYTRKKQPGQETGYRIGLDRPEEERVVVDLSAALQAWVDEADREDAIRVICGGPGCGKSSFTKILAATLAETAQVPVLYIPLHLFDLSAELDKAVGAFVQSDPDGLLPPNPLEREQAEPRVLLIFDGLDELAKQGKVGIEAAQQFVREAQKQLYRLNQRTTRLQILISGRDVAVQANSVEFQREGQILHILPYFVPVHERTQYVDDHKLLADDHRDRWWQNYGIVSGRAYTGLPKELDQGNLIEITGQPLLNYLVALSYGQGRLSISETTNLNEIYTDLLRAIHERGWASRRQHPSLQGVTLDNFVRILEEVALSSWHGDGRTTTVREIESHCASSDGLRRLLDIFQEGAQAGVTRLLTAFYFRQSGLQSDGEKTFEFTHKSFGEYLTAKRIVRGIGRIHNEMQSHQQDLDQGWNARQALKHWAMLCGPSLMDEYLFRFLCDEIQLQPRERISQWQKTLSALMGTMLKAGMPMEELKLQTYYEEHRQARNAEESLLAALNACARHTQEISHIAWSSPETFGSWLIRIQGQRTNWEKNTLAVSCLGWLDLANCNLIGQDLTNGSLTGAYLERAALERTRLNGANLEGANLNGANLNGASMVGTNLEEANLNEAQLNGANLSEANLERARLSGASLERTGLIEANLIESWLEEAWLNGADLSEASLQGARLNKASLVEVNLNDAWLEGANLNGAKLNGSNLERAWLEGSNLSSASLEGANLNGAKLNGARLNEANLNGASLSGAILNGANLQSVVWNKETRWDNSNGLNAAINVPEALKEKLGLS
ncbi:pentapeptide repeat-containing protein [Stenomitos frigidus]|uniref:Uncharacterized protein n=1 Tax=Stenomitos frigidus ULC18 TaxID=2107698 RepID=A0A2T1E0G2_9CYAN|nr:pentapeptide repeat-containing protein [Stenomitos frigidus]PSB26199.1 hypothetical protein C7B82_20480 [Stenomitos frigidus ULC18]